MKAQAMVALLTISLISCPVFAQLGPAGVPGIFEFTESLLAPAQPPAPPKTQAPTSAVASKQVDSCTGNKNPEQCRLKRDARAKAVETCKDKKGEALKQCLRTQIPINECNLTSDPQRCMQHYRAKQACQDKLGPEHRQCLRDNLVARK